MNLKSIITVMALILIMFMAAIETSIISLALPTIKNSLNAGNLVSLVFTVYFIALVIANPIVGELMSRFKIIYIAVVGVLLFALGSLMSGLSQTFTFLIISRTVQGFGAGVMMSLSQIVPKLAFEIPLRYKIMGIVAIILVLMTFHFPDETQVQQSRFDIKGLIIFYIFIALLMFGLLNQHHIIFNIFSIILALAVLWLLFKIENSIEQPFLPTKEFNISIVLVFITDLLIAITLMGYNLYIPVYLQEKLSLSPLQSGFVIFPLSVAWITLNFNLGKIEAHFTRKTLYICSFFVLLVSSLMIMFGLKLPLLIAFAVVFAGLSFGYIYTKDSVIVQEETSPKNMKKMMSFYALTKNLGSSVGSTIMGYMYALNVGLFGSNLHNVLGLVLIIAVCLIVMWMTLYKSNTIQS